MNNRLHTTIAVLALGMLAMPVLRSGEFVINETKPVDLIQQQSIHDVWSAAKIDYPDTDLIFSYNSKGIEFCVFQLKKEKRFLIFFSQSESAKVRLSKNGVQADEGLDECFIRHTEGNDKTIQNRFLGYIFTLDDTEPCEITCTGSRDAVNYTIKVKKNADGWWSCSANAGG